MAPRRSSIIPTFEAIRDRVADRYVFWARTKEWAKAFGGPTVSRERVAKTVRIPEPCLAAYEEIRVQERGED